jgi:PHP family Zn ribbon phosphoesterase
MVKCKTSWCKKEAEEDSFYCLDCSDAFSEAHEDRIKEEATLTGKEEGFDK